MACPSNFAQQQFARTTKRRLHATNFRRRIYAALACSIGWQWCSSGAAAAIANESTYDLNIDGRALADSLQEFARQSGLQVIFFSELTEGLRAPTVKGRFAVETAMAALLSRSSLTFRILNARTVQVSSPVNRPEKGSARAVATAARPDQNADAVSPPKVVDEVTVLGVTEGLVATRVETPWREIPQTISIVSREQIRQQNDVDLSDVLRHAVGVTTQRADSLSETFFSRGFAITTFHVDGGAALVGNYGGILAILDSPDMSEFERVEVLRGADALFGGEGNPGATVNLIRKRPRATEQFFVTASLGSWSDRRLEADLTGPVALDGALRGRVDVLSTNKNYFFNKAFLQRRKISGALEYDLTATTLLTIGGSYQRDDALPVTSGAPLLADGSDPRVPRSTALQYDWASYRSSIGETYLKLNQSFGNHWTLRINGSAYRGTLEASYGTLLSNPLNPVTRELTGTSLIVDTTRPNPFHQYAFDATLSGVFQWFDRRSEVAVGVDRTRQKQTTALRDYQPAFHVGADLDLSGYPHPSATAIPDVLGQATRTDNIEGLFASLRTDLSDRWSITAGARISDADLSLSNDSTYLGTPIKGLSGLADSHVVTPYFGLLYKFDESYSLYASYADIFNISSAERRKDGSLIGPPHGMNFEIGIKSVWRDGRLTGALTFYRIEQNNATVFDTSPGAAVDPTSCCFRSAINQSRGVDAELSGLLTDGWQFGGGYSYNTNLSAIGGPLSAITPRHLFKLWTSAQLPGSLQRVSLGAAIHAQNAAPVIASASTTVEQGSYAVIDARASVRLNDNWVAAVNVNNVFDRVYYENSGLLSGNWYGTPRSFLFQISGRY